MSGVTAVRSRELRQAQPEAPPLAGEVQDDLLRMLFVCCDTALPAQSQLVLALKVLCGFGVREIALRLFCSEANVYKRLQRARRRLREAPLQLEAVSGARLFGVHQILYLLFTEGYLTTGGQTTLQDRAMIEQAGFEVQVVHA